VDGHKTLGGGLEEAPPTEHINFFAAEVGQCELKPNPKS
jgi:hypothetical protein